MYWRQTRTLERAPRRKAVEVDCPRFDPSRKDNRKGCCEVDLVDGERYEVEVERYSTGD